MTDDNRVSGGNAPSIHSWPAQPPAFGLLDIAPRMRAAISIGRVAPLPDPPAVGSLVKRGEILCDCHDGSAAATLAPTSGKVIGTGSIELLNGKTVRAVEIESDFEDQATDALADSPAADLHALLNAREPGELPHMDSGLSRADLAPWIEQLRARGVWADRRGSPDLLGQLHHALLHPVDTVICSVLDEDPLLQLNSVLAARAPGMLLNGVTVLARLIEARKMLIAVDSAAPWRWWANLRKLARDCGAVLETLVNDYPQADVTLLIYTLLRRRLRSGSLPTEQRVLVIDAATAIAIGQVAADSRISMLRVPLALRDHLAGQTHYVVAPVGISLRQVTAPLAPAAPRHAEDPWPAELALLRGHVLREQRCGPDTVVSAGELTLHLLPRLPAPAADPCIRCGWCGESCPTRAQPAGLLEAAQRNNAALARHYGLGACIECGICTYVCPSRLGLLAGIRTIKRS